MGNTAENTKYDFFISFADDAKEWVHGVLVPKLERSGKTFVLVGEITGNAWIDDLQANIETSEKILVVVTPQYCTSQRHHLLQLMAFTKGVERREWPVVPLLLKSVDLELFLRFINGVNLTQYQSEEQLDALFAVPPRSQEEQQQLDVSPYPGMQTFEEEDASRFFGREEEIDQYLKALRNEHILVLTGASGCGKSSLARAGIIPRLKAKHHFLVKTVRPIDNDLDSWLEQAEAALKNGDELIKQFLSLEQPDQSFLLFIDQFEELFSVEPDDRSNFILSIKAKQLLSLLVKLKKQVPGFYLLITLRAEFYPQLAFCQVYIDFDNYLQRINALSREGLTDAITKPALKKYVYIDERLVERLVTEAGDDPGILPFVQETLRDLWEKRYENYIGLEAYENLGRNSGSGLKASIAAKADAAYKALISIDKEHRFEEENITKRIFLRLIQFSQGKPNTRRQQSISDLRSDQDNQAVFEGILKHLSSENYRLLTINRGEEDDDSTVDIVHESLIDAWPMLTKWIKEYKDFEIKIRLLNFKLMEWKRFGKNEGGSLDKKELKEAELIVGDSLFKIFGSGVEVEEFLFFSKKLIDPGWNSLGLINIFIISLEFILFIIIFISFVINLSDFYIKIILITLFFFCLVLIAVIWFQGRDNVYRFKKYSHKINKKKIFYFGLALCMISCSVLVLVSYKKIENRNFCDKSGYIRNDEVSNLNIAFLDDENKEQLITNLLVTQALGFSNKISYSILSNSDYAKCYYYFDYSVSFNRVNQDDQEGFKVSIKNLNEKEEKNIEFFHSIDERMPVCVYSSELIYRVLEKIPNLNKLGVILNDYTEGVYSEAFCQAYTKNTQALEVYIKGDLDYAEKLANESIAYEKNYAEAYSTLGTVLLKKHQYDKAVKSYKRASELVPSSLLLGLWANAMHKQNMATGKDSLSVEVESVLNLAIDKDRNLFGNYNFLVNAYLDFYLNEKAYPFLEKMEDFLNFNQVNIIDEIYFYKNMGKYYLNIKNIDKAIYFLRKANDSISLDGGIGIYEMEVDIFYLLGLAYEDKKDSKSVCNFWNGYLKNLEYDYLAEKRKMYIDGLNIDCLKKGE